eukprot:6781979-Prymnesium_polylepis.2
MAPYLARPICTPSPSRMVPCANTLSTSPSLLTSSSSRLCGVAALTVEDRYQPESAPLSGMSDSD